jgi:predicted site-specific integrase-resolvase
MFGVHRTTVHRWVEAGDLPIALEVNGVRMFSASAVERFAAERETVG